MGYLNLQNPQPLAGAVGKVTQVARAIGLDDRIGPRFLHAGIGWGGSCFGKDTRAIVATAARYDYDLQLVRASMEVNRLQRLRIIEKLQDHLKVLRGRTIGILGLAFKGGTDDLRESPPLTLIEVLADRGATVRAHDPIAIPNATKQHPDLPVEYAEDVVELARDCDAVVLATDWADYRHPPLEAMREVMRGDLFLDARNLLDAEDVEAAGLRYVGVGR